MIKTYSFEDTTLNISHPSVGSWSGYGTGLGTVTVSYSEDISSMQVAADLTVVISKHAYRHGTITISVNQASEFNSFLKKLVNYVKTANADEFALTSGILRNGTTGDTWTLSGVAPQKNPDTTYDSQSGFLQYVFNVASLTNN